MYNITIFEDSDKEKYENDKSYMRLIVGSNYWTKTKEGIMMKDRNGDYFPGWAYLPGRIAKPITVPTKYKKFDELVITADGTMYGHLRPIVRN